MDYVPDDDPAWDTEAEAEVEIELRESEDEEHIDDI